MISAVLFYRVQQIFAYGLYPLNKVDENGNVMLNVCEKGEYVIMLCEYSDRKGDVSNDGVTNALDAAAILRDAVELEAAPNAVMLDYNGDGKTNAFDASAILIDIANDKI